jgi:DNA-binding SARP family transcriptional activator
VPIGAVDTGDERGRSAPSAPLRLQILGPLRIWRDGVELDPGPPQQAHLLALLIARAGRPTSVTELVELLWGQEAPVSALNVIHKYVGTLRRLLDPTIAPRDAGAHLLRRGTGYLFTAGPDTLDLVGFRESVAAAEAALAERQEHRALDYYVDALALWAAPAGDGLTHGPAAMAIFAGLNGEFFDACAAATDLAVSLGQPERVLGPLHLAATMAPLHEPVQAGLITAMGAAGRQAEALAVFRRVRARLAEEIGIDPGQALEAAHRRVLSQTVASTDGGLVGRVDELAVLRQAVESAFAGHVGLAIVEGEPGVGKTHLLRQITSEAERRGAQILWGSCLDGEGTPSMWPWVQAVSSVVATLPDDARRRWLDSDLGRLVEPREGILAAPVLPDSGTQFRLFERVVDVVAQASALKPLVLVLDDLHWADVASLHLFSHLATRLPSRTLFIGALRDRAPAPGTELARTLAAVSRVPGHRRIRLGPLNLAEVTELVRRETGQDPESSVARSIHARTAGNPFFVRELSRFLADGGALAADTAVQAGVPATVRDVVQDRLTRLDEGVEDLLQTAALIGRDVSIELLAASSGVDVQTCLHRLEPLAALGFLEATPGNPYSYRFTHDLVRQSVAESTPPRRATRLHVRIADSLERTGADDESVAERLAYHLWSAGPLAEPARTASALVRAGSCAATKSALEAAERLLRSAVQAARNAGLTELELSALSQLVAVVGMRQMYGTAALDLLERAEHLARTLGREVEAAAFLFSRWTAHVQAIELDRSGPLARRLLEGGDASSDPTMRLYGLQAWGIQQSHAGNVGEGFRYVSQFEQPLLAGLARRDEDPVRADLQLLMTGMLAEITALHGDVEAARVLLDKLEAVAGDNPYRITVWATMVARTASVIGDSQWALRGAERGIAVDEGFSFVFLGTYQRLARCWALALAGENPAAAIAEAQRVIAANLLDPPRSCVATWYALLGEMHLATGATDEAAAALDRADFYLNAYGQRYPEGLILLLRARLLHARGAPVSAVRAAAEKVRALSADRGAHLFAHRADELLAGLR